jgi:hypothetical protein
MLTSEAAHDKVISAAELQPTEYILKPFTAETLNQRIQRALARRAAMLPAYQLSPRAIRAAIRTCIGRRDRQPRHAVDFARLRAELHASLKEHEQAEGVYRQLIAARPLGWARLGLARACSPGPHRGAIETAGAAGARQSAPDGGLRPAGALPRGARRSTRRPRRRSRKRSASRPTWCGACASWAKSRWKPATWRPPKNPSSRW